MVHYHHTVALGALAYALVMPAVGFAQVTPDQVASSADTPDIIVTGIRRSLTDAANIKRNEVVVSDAISAEDIGRFPDQNLAESLQRITGVQITRNKGEGSAISVRGLSPDFTRTQYNGRTITTTSGGRSFNFTSLTSDFVSAVEVYKTPTADTVDGGLSATVNVRTSRPLDVGKDRYALTVEGIYEDNPRKVTPHVSGFVNKVLGDGTFGINFGVNYEKRKVQTFSYSAFGLEPATEATRTPPLDYNLDGDTLDAYRFNHAAGLIVSDGYNERLTAIGGIQIKPADNVDLHADVFYSRYKDEADLIGTTLRFTNIAGPGAGIVGSAVDGDVLTFMDANGVDLRNNGRHPEFSDNTFSAAAGGTFDFGPLKASTEFSYSKSKREFTNLGLEVLGRASASQDLRPDRSGIPLISFNRGYDPLNPANFNALGFNGSYKAPTTDRNWDGRVDLTYDVGEGFVRAVKFGGIYSDRKNSFRSSSVRINAQQLAGALGVPYNAGIEGGSFNAAAFMQAFNYPRALNNYSGDGALPTSFLTSTNALLFNAIPLDDLLALSSPVSDLASDFSVQEKVFATYARADFSSSDDRFAGNIGLRYVRTRQTSIGFAPDLTQLIFSQQGAQTIIPNVTPLTVKNNYDNWLPSLNLKFNVTDKLVARFGAARVLTRPDLNLLSTSTNVNANVRTVTQFNPQLQPYTADQIDLSFEYYFGQGGIVSAAAFYKNVKNFVVSTTRTQSLTLTNAEGGGTITLPFTFFAPDNAADTKLKGIELGAQVPFTFLPSPFDGFGVIANLTYLDVGKVATSEGGTPQPLPGVSKWSYNLAGYYEKEGFGIRLSYNYRSGFTGDQSVNFFNDGVFNKAYGQLDASLSYDINPNFTLNLDVTNINEAAVQTYDGFGVGRGFEDVGRRVTAGVRAKF